VWDTHKLMLMPALCTAVLFRDGGRAHQAFAQEASYLFAEHGETEPPWFDVATRTLECTKLMMSLKLYAALALHGPGFFGGYVTGMFALAAGFAARIAAAPDFQLAVPPDCNIVCFRHVPADHPAAELDELQARVRRRLIEDGGFYLVQTRLPAGVFLRVTLLNPFTTLADLAALLDAVRAAAARG
jgi:L-2,4-diaminobutyrate decarboxylase